MIYIDTRMIKDSDTIVFDEWVVIPLNLRIVSEAGTINFQYKQPQLNESS